MKLHRRQFLQLAAGAAALPVTPRVAFALDYPTRPVRILVGFPGGSSSDVAARLIGQSLSERLGRQFFVENRPGAASNLAAEAAERASPDGYTLLLFDTVNAIDVTLYNNPSLIHDIVPVASITRGPGLMVVNPKFPAKSVPEFIAYAKANPGKINMATAGSGSMLDVYGELFMMLAGVDMERVPYRGAPPAVTDLVGGRVRCCIRYLCCVDRFGQSRPVACAGGYDSNALGSAARHSVLG